MEQERPQVEELEALEGVATRTVELVLLAAALAERMRGRTSTPRLSANLTRLDETVRRGQRYLQRLVEEDVDVADARSPTPIRRR